MQKLKHTSVSRKGMLSSGVSRVEKFTNSFRVRKPFDGESFIKGKEALEFNIKISAAGVGITDIYIDIGRDEFPAIFELIAKEIPETASMFSKCTTIAINSTVESQDT